MLCKRVVSVLSPLSLFSRGGSHIEDVWDKAINLVIPSYVLTVGSSSNAKKSALSANATDMNGILERYLKEVKMQTVMAAEREDVSINKTQSCKWPLIISTLPVFFNLVILQVVKTIFLSGFLYHHHHHHYFIKIQI